MPSRDVPRWSRRRLLQAGGLAAVPALRPRLLRAVQAPSQEFAPFSRFTDVAAQAGLTQPIVYGIPSQVTYINESMGGGCAFFDYDNDGWIDVFIVGGRRLDGVPPGSGNRLYHNNR